MRLHRPKRNVWNTALILLLVGLLLAFAPLPIPAFFGGWAFWLVTVSAVVMLLGTSIF